VVSDWVNLDFIGGHHTGTGCSGAGRGVRGNTSGGVRGNGWHEVRHGDDGLATASGGGAASRAGKDDNDRPTPAESTVWRLWHRVGEATRMLGRMGGVSICGGRSKEPTITPWRPWKEEKNE
jgi:hypothetical protein